MKSMKNKTKDYHVFYQRLTSPLKNHPYLLKALVCFNRLMTLLMPMVYAGALLKAYLAESWRGLVLYFSLPAAGFILLSLVRRWINQPRPYESWNISPLLTKEASGNSMPSRHVFSSTVIAMAALSLSPWLGLALLFLTALLALVRVVGGVHYPKDVLVGYACGLLVGGFLYLF